MRYRIETYMDDRWLFSVHTDAEFTVAEMTQRVAFDLSITELSDRLPPIWTDLLNVRGVEAICITRYAVHVRIGKAFSTSQDLSEIQRRVVHQLVRHWTTLDDKIVRGKCLRGTLLPELLFLAYHSSRDESDD